MQPKRYNPIVASCWEDLALKACLLIRVRPGHHRQVAEKISKLPKVKEAFSVMGTADVVVRVEVSDLRAMTDLGTEIGNLEDVVTTETLIGAEA
jgi:DNA-binding Lrp family transcriptional regulator